jgi:hypothetical protein
MVTPCLSVHDACTIYPLRPGTRSCCRTRELYDQGHATVEQCETLAVRREGFVEVSR